MKMIKSAKYKKRSRMQSFSDFAVNWLYSLMVKDSRDVPASREESQATLPHMRAVRWLLLFTMALT